MEKLSQRLSCTSNTRPSFPLTNLTTLAKKRLVRCSWLTHAGSQHGGKPEQHEKNLAEDAHVSYTKGRNVFFRVQEKMILRL